MTMYFKINDLVISDLDILETIFTVYVGIFMLKILTSTIRNVNTRTNKSDDYPGSIKLEDEENLLYTERREKVIFEETISNAVFRYDEKTRILTIENRNKLTDANVPPISMQLDSIVDLREFVDRLEEYVDE